MKFGGQWLQFVYPYERWRREGEYPPDVWGQRTDGPGTPWADWLDVPKLLETLSPAQFEVVLYHEFYNREFNWFDLKYLGPQAL